MSSTEISTDEALTEIWTELYGSEQSSEAILNTLREAVLSQTIPAGEQLTEEHLTTLFGVSRTPIREAVLRLETEKLIQRRTRRGFVVRPVSPAEALEIYDVRIALDGLAAQLAASFATPPDVAQLRWINSQMRTAGGSGDFELMSQLNLEFHEWVGRSARNDFLVAQIETMNGWVRRFSGTTFSQPGRWIEAVGEHDRIADAIERKDPVLGRRLAEEHMTAAKTVRLAMIEEQSRNEQSP